MRKSHPSILKRVLFSDLPLEHETALFLMVSAVDFGITVFALPRAGFREANPIAAGVLQIWGVRGLLHFKFFATGLVCLLAQAIARRRIGYARFVLNLATLCTALVVVYSLSLLARHFAGN
ncbi:MAG: hypothetical protein GXP31_01280 [Kiritimatiellaeota bacterium]|nr:hypothetical protein [Kiritimatiellota bacterium]